MRKTITKKARRPQRKTLFYYPQWRASYLGGKKPLNVKNYNHEDAKSTKKTSQAISEDYDITSGLLFRKQDLPHLLSREQYIPLRLIHHRYRHTRLWP